MSEERHEKSRSFPFFFWVMVMVIIIVILVWSGLVWSGLVFWSGANDGLLGSFSSIVLVMARH